MTDCDQYQGVSVGFEEKVAYMWESCHDSSNMVYTPFFLPYSPPVGNLLYYGVAVHICLIKGYFIDSIWEALQYI